MNQDHIQRLRNPQFTIGRRGYEMREVDGFMLRMADWLESDAVEEIGTYAVQRKLELVGKTTTHILQTTEAEAEELRKEAEAAAAAVRGKAKQAVAASRAKADEYAEETRAKANAYNEDVRKKADEYAARTRKVADDEARSLVDGATAKANQIVAKGEQRREAMETVIADLRARRDEVLDQLDRLSTAVSGTVSDHRAAAAPANGVSRRPKAQPAGRASPSQ